ncbi:LOW QUALITY PROTEIN: hypothetical protein MAR_025478 [Mya arenaria]|uniref:Uncharacterized protein n=1 Tax=Mya arenaria TaxID=6604 RepID=A0ABY7EMT9_MYAAR|nr:LOW QUALITY PROTEIN: hypothetical protein MAR_025478 [Mya arenaria]
MAKNGLEIIEMTFMLMPDFAMLNGRDCLKDDFTCIRSQGCSVVVVDYCLVSHEKLHLFSNFSVMRARELVQKAEMHGFIGIPDHSFLTWEYDFDKTYVRESGVPISVQPHADNVIFRAKSIPDDLFSGDVCEMLFKTVNSLEQNLQTQENMDQSYPSLCSLIKVKLFDRVPHRKTVSLSYVNNKKRNLYKPWWREYLIELWNDVCVHEKYWLKATYRSFKTTLKILYLLEFVKIDSNTFWKTIGKIDVASKKMPRIPMEFVNNDGSIEYDALRSCNDTLINGLNGGDFENNICIFEVSKAVEKARQQNAPGFDIIPYEVFKNDIAISFLHIFFNLCYQKGKTTSDWGKGVLNPIPKPANVWQQGVSMKHCTVLEPFLDKLSLAYVSWKSTCLPTDCSLTVSAVSQRQSPDLIFQPDRLVA